MTAGDVEAIREVEGVQSAVPEYSCDVQWKQESDVRNVRLMSLDETINRISVTEGRLPETTAECLMDQRLAQMTGTKPGDVIPLSTGDDTLLEDRISGDQVTVVGETPIPEVFCRSCRKIMYITFTLPERNIPIWKNIFK